MNGSSIQRFRSVVIGAGPSGLAAVANLLDADVHPLLWVDPSFTSGRLSRYQHVPSNTKVQLFIDYVLASPTLSQLADHPLHELRQMDPSTTCPLSHTVQMVTCLTSELRNRFSHKLFSYQGWVHQITLHDDKSPTWSVAVGDSEEQKDNLTLVDASSVIFATGSYPTELPPSVAPHEIHSAPGCKIQQITLETGLNPQALAQVITSDDTVAVVGSSHSSVLCLKNLAELQCKPRKILHYYREKFKYAVQMDGWILYDNTGLKGEAAVWAKNVLESGAVPLIESHNLSDPATTESAVYEKSMQSVTKIIYTIGFSRNKLPKLLLEGCEGEATERVEYLGKTGKLVAGQKRLPGLWGYGIAFPEQVVDPHGNHESSVGLWKFMKYLKKVIPQDVVPELEISDHLSVEK